MFLKRKEKPTRAERHTKHTLTKEERHSRRWRRTGRTLIYTAGIIIILHIALPVIILYFLNKKLADMPEYVGHIDDMGINLFKGSASVYDFDMKKKNGKIPVPFAHVTKVKVGVEWKSLLKGRIVATIIVDNFSVNFVNGPTKEQSQTSVKKDWVDLVKELMPIDVNRLEVKDGEVHFRDFYRSPKVDVKFDKIYVLGQNLSNVNDSNVLLPGKITMKANALGGTMTANLKIDALSKIPKFDINAEIKRLPLPKLNDFIKAYGKFDVQKGYFSIYLEAATKNNKINGYAKPFVEDLDVLNLSEEKDDPLKTKFYEAIIEVGAWIFKNHKTDQLATRIDIEGDLKDPTISVWQIISDALRNAFVKGLFQSLDETVNINTVGKEHNKTFLEKIFGSGEDKKDKKAAKEAKKKAKAEKKAKRKKDKK